MHPGPERVRQGLGHERGVHAEILRHLLHDETERHHVVGHRERVRVTQVDLVLARAELVEAVLDGDPHGLEREDRLLAQLAHHVHLREVEVRRLVERLGRARRLEIEELHLRTGVEGESLLTGALEVSLEDVARIAFERLAVETVHVAEHARDGRVLAAPRHDLERARVGPGEHVGFLDARVPLDRGAVEGHALFERAFELGRRDGEALELAEHVGEPEAHEAHASFFDGSEHVVEWPFHPTSVAARSAPTAARNRRSGSLNRAFIGGQWMRNRRLGACARR